MDKKQSKSGKPQQGGAGRSDRDRQQEQQGGKKSQQPGEKFDRDSHSDQSR
ncbi:hypothetical protein [Erythrobacter alti]|uniref:hypothetical protein n=1 Tax=Erythrobacter alti TaxID=1896145 RepID=UPI0030F3FA37